jgi:hypothetical protein
MSNPKKKKVNMLDVAMMFRYKTNAQVVEFLSQHIHNRTIDTLDIKQQDRIYIVMGIAKNLYKRYRSHNTYLYK